MVVPGLRNHGKNPATNVSTAAVILYLVPADSFEAILIVMPTRTPTKADPKEIYANARRRA